MFVLEMGSRIDSYILKHYLPKESEPYFQGKVLLFNHLSIIILMAIVISLSPGGFTPKLLFTSILLTSLISIFFIAQGYINIAILLSYTGIGFFASLLIFSRESYQNFEVYALVAVHMFITLVASLLTQRRFHTHVTTSAGAIYLTLLLFIRGLRLATPENPLEIDDYVIGMALLVLTGFITRNTLDRRKRLLEISESESARNLKQALELRQSLKEKELLLHEVHHRVKNNLNVAISLQRMQIRNLDPSNVAINALQESIGRLNSMALVHERLYAVGDFNAIDFKPYILAICNSVIHTLHKENVTFTVNIDNGFSLDLTRAVPCGLIMNELITNICKHAFPADEKGLAEITVTLSAENLVTIMVRDEGIGINPGDYSGSNSLGMHLIALLTEQLAGVQSIQGNSSGTTVSITFPLSDS